MKIFNVTDFGAGENGLATASIQRAVDACAEAGGGMVYVPPGDYTSGTIHLRSNVRFHIESGSILRASRNKDDFEADSNALFFAQDVDRITLEGRGIVHGGSEYVWDEREHPDDFIADNREITRGLGLPLIRAFPVDAAMPRMVQFIRCNDVVIRDLSFLESPSWTMHPVGCERLLIDGVYIHTDRKSGVWADGIDPDGCKDVRISNCTVDTGDDALVFYSMDWHGPATPCENITVTNCRLSSSSSAIKFCDGNRNCIRNVTISNCVITDSNRGIAFMLFDGGYVRDVVISDVTVETHRHDWFWWGDGEPIHFNIKRRSEVHTNHTFENEPPAGSISNVKISNVIARGEGACFINGHPDSYLEHIEFENVRLFLDPRTDTSYTKGESGLVLRHIDDVTFRNVSVELGEAAGAYWKYGFDLCDVQSAVFRSVTASAAFALSAPLNAERVESIDSRDSAL